MGVENMIAYTKTSESLFPMLFRQVGMCRSDFSLDAEGLL